MGIIIEVSLKKNGSDFIDFRRGSSFKILPQCMLETTSNTHLGTTYWTHKSFMRWHTFLNLHFHCFNTEAEFLTERKTSMCWYSSCSKAWGMKIMETDCTISHCLENLSKPVTKYSGLTVRRWCSTFLAPKKPLLFI